MWQGVGEWTSRHELDFRHVVLAYLEFLPSNQAGSISGGRGQMNSFQTAGLIREVLISLLDPVLAHSCEIRRETLLY